MTSSSKGFVGHAPSEESGRSCKVLIIDDDSQTLAELSDSIDVLGYAFETAGSAMEGLRCFSRDADIGIILCDVRLPDMDGIELIREVSIRFSEDRPIVAILISGHTDLEMAITALRLGVDDLLRKPIKPVDLARSLREGFKLWKQRTEMLDRSAHSPPTSALTLPIIPNAQEHLLIRPADKDHQVAPREHEEAEDSQSTSDIVELLRLIMRERDRSDINPMFGDPAWDITLELMHAKISGEPMPVSSACTASNAPMSTSLRWIRNMHKGGLIRRWNDPDDKRRDLVELEDEYFESLCKFFDTVRKKRKLKGN